MKRLLSIVLCIFLCMPLCGCEKIGNTKEYSTEFFAMDTYMSMTAYGKNAKEAVETAKEEILRLEQLLSTNIATSEVAQVNANNGGEVSEDTASLIERSLFYYEQTDGAYDITIYPLVYEWGFTTKDFQVLSESRVEELLPLVGSDKLHLEGEKKNKVVFDQEGMMIDLGTIAKGYASQRASEIFKEYGVESGLINLGGNVQLVGAKPDGADWRVAIQKPDKDAPDTDYIGTLDASDCAITTAGGYERYFEEDGVIYRHIFDPATGCPTESSLKSVSVIAKNGVDADGYDTALFVMGLQNAVSFWRLHQEEFDVIIVGSDDTIYVSEEISDKFSVNGANYRVEVLH